MSTRKQHKQRTRRTRKQRKQRRYGGVIPPGKNPNAAPFRPRMNPGAAPFVPAPPALDPHAAPFVPQHQAAYNFPYVMSPNQSAQAAYARLNPQGSLKPYNGRWRKHS
jgi:hypothetical protein